jgi:hypothetical protein
MTVIRLVPGFAPSTTACKVTGGSSNGPPPNSQSKTPPMPRPPRPQMIVTALL